MRQASYWGGRALLILGAAGLIVGLFAPWYRVTFTSEDESVDQILSMFIDSGPATYSGWEALSVIDILVALAAVTIIALMLLATWRPSRTIIAGIAVVIVVSLILVGVRLASPPEFVPAAPAFDDLTAEAQEQVDSVASRQAGIYVALAGAVLALVGAGPIAAFSGCAASAVGP